MGARHRHTDIFRDDKVEDFVVRRRIPPMWQLFILFFLCFMALFLVAVNAQYLGGATGIAMAIFAVIGPLTWFTVYFNQRNRDMVLAAEFQNALFAAAARLKTRFCMIAKKDGAVFYYDRGFQDVFPVAAQRGTLMVDKIFDHQLLPPSEAEKLYRALDNNSSTSLFMNLPEEGGQPKRLIITMDPLQRPAGFFILRGRDYVVKQYERSQGGQNLNIADNPAASATLAYMLHLFPEGIYATDAEGHFLFVNYRFESWLGYNQNEILSRALALHDLVPQHNTEIAEHLLLKPCAGEVQFVSKSGRPLQLFLQQELVKDERGSVTGSVAFLKPDAVPFAPSPQSDSSVMPVLMHGKTFQS